MSTRTAELLAGIGLLVFSLVLMWTVYTDGLTIGWVDGRGPGAGVWPFWLSLGMALTSVWTVARWFRRTTAESRNEAPYIDSDPFALVAISFVSLTVMIFLVAIVGTYIRYSQRKLSIHRNPSSKIGRPLGRYFVNCHSKRK